MTAGYGDGGGGKKKTYFVPLPPSFVAGPFSAGVAPAAAATGVVGSAHCCCCLHLLFVVAYGVRVCVCVCGWVGGWVCISFEIHGSSKTILIRTSLSLSLFFLIQYIAVAALVVVVMLPASPLYYHFVLRDSRR